MGGQGSSCRAQTYRRPQAYRKMPDHQIQQEAASRSRLHLGGDQGRRSQQEFRQNVQRLKEYKSKLILFPKKLSKPHKGDATKEEMDVATQVTSKAIIPVVEVETIEPPREITEDEAKFSAYQTLRKARAHKRFHKFRLLKAKKKADEEKNAPKKK